MHVNMSQAATSGTKWPEVLAAARAYLNADNHQNAGRGGDELAAAQAALESRLALAAFFGAHSPAHVIFTSGATESLNMAIHGLAGEGCHVLASQFEHNAVARPLHLLQQQGRIEVTWLPCGSDGAFDAAAVSAHIKPNTRLFIMTHASNVTGDVLPVAQAFEAAKKYGGFTLLDAAQTAGHIPVALDKNTDAIAFTAHKGMRALAGTGGLILNQSIAEEMAVWKAGGTGSHSQFLDMPGFLPDRLEPGTPNTLGITALRAAVEAIDKTGLAAIAAREGAMMGRLREGLMNLPLTVYGGRGQRGKVPVVSINIPGLDAGLLARRLLQEYGIETRSGLHCAPLAHRALGTYPAGTLRLSCGADTTEQEVDYTLQALGAICRAD